MNSSTPGQELAPVLAADPRMAAFLERLETVLSPTVIRNIREFYTKAPELGGYVKPQPLALSWPRLLAAWRSYSNPSARFAAAALYCTGQRVGEFMATRRGDVDLKWLEGRPYVVVESITEKTKVTPRRSIPVPLNRRDDEIASYFWNRVKQIDDPEAKLWPFSVKTIWNYLATAELRVTALDFQTLQYHPVDLRLHAHYLRHCRATHLAVDYGYGFLELKKYFGWTSNSMPDLYVSMAWQTLAKAFDNEPISGSEGGPGP